MKVEVVSKVGCARCLLLKQKLELMGVEWGESDGSGVDIEGMGYPVTIIDGVPYEYAAAIKKLKETLDEDDV